LVAVKNGRIILDSLSSIYVVESVVMYWLANYVLSSHLYKTLIGYLIQSFGRIITYTF